MNAKQLMICAAIMEILQIFADTEIGGHYEIDYDKIADYINSFRCPAEYFECSTKEDVYERFTQDIYAGLPVWRWLKLPEWTLKMVERTFEDECQAEYREMCRMYKCLTCKYYEARNTEIGVFQKCNYRKEEPNRMCNRHYHSLKRDEPFELKKKCRNYEVKVAEEYDNIH